VEAVPAVLARLLRRPEAELAQQLYDAGTKTVQQIADLFDVPRTTVYGHLDKTTIGKRPRRPATGPGRRDYARS
jgi:predicted transcriptional regulator YheO